MEGGENKDISDSRHGQSLVLCRGTDGGRRGGWWGLKSFQTRMLKVKKSKMVSGGDGEFNLQYEVISMRFKLMRYILIVSNQLLPRNHI